MCQYHTPQLHLRHGGGDDGGDGIHHVRGHSRNGLHLHDDGHARGHGLGQACYSQNSQRLKSPLILQDAFH